MNDIYLNNKYTTLYYNIVDRAKQRILDSDIYTEQHHIIPECFFINRKRKGTPGWLVGDPDDPNNIVRLTAKEHYICHLLLTKMTTGLAKQKMYNALWRFMTGKSNTIQRDVKITARIYEMVRNECAKISAIRTKQVHTGRKRSEETKRKISEANRGKIRTLEIRKKYRKAQLESTYEHSKETIEKIRQARLNREVPDTTREKISNALTGRKGKPWSEETREKMKKRVPWNKGKPGFKHSDETREKIAQASSQKKHTQESIEKMRKAKTGTKFSEETKKKMSEMRKGVKRKPMSEETKRKIGEANRLRHLEKIKADPLV